MVLNKKGLFITFEGADGSGKTSQLKLVADYLKEQNYNIVATRDPGGTPLGGKIREILLNYEGKVASYCELFLYLADRAQHIEEKIMPALGENKIVLCDRYVDSTLAYQGYARGLDKDEILKLNNIVAQSLMPDLTIVFDVDTEVAEKRVGDEKDRLESEAKDFHKKVRLGYLDLATKYPERIRVVNANNDIETVYSDVLDILNSYLNQEQN